MVCCRSAERARPLDDYNNGVVMTHRPLYDNEFFEIRIEKLVDKWSGSIEVILSLETLNPGFHCWHTNTDITAPFCLLLGSLNILLDISYYLSYK